MLNLDPDGFQSGHHQHAASKLHVKDEVWLRKQEKEQIPLILGGAFTGPKKKEAAVIFLR